jgi:membrane protein YqaA with SNARE-associated domain
MCIGVGVMMVVAGLSGLLLQQPLRTFGSWTMDQFGLWGLFFGTMFTDSSPLPLTNEPLMMLALAAGVSPLTILWVVSTASVIAGFVGYACGSMVARHPRLRAWILSRSPELAQWMKNRGGLAVAVAALLPIPYSLATWSAGIVHTPLRAVALGTLFRIPKTAFYLALIWLGWSAGTIAP